VDPVFRAVKRDVQESSNQTLIRECGHSKLEVPMRTFLFRTKLVNGENSEDLGKKLNLLPNRLREGFAECR
jgi:hypothetical protein